MTTEGELLIIKLLTGILHAVYRQMQTTARFTTYRWKTGEITFNIHEDGHIEEAINAGYRYIENREAK